MIGSKTPDFRGLFLRGYGSKSHTQNNGANVGNTTTNHVSGNLGAIQGDAVRKGSGKGTFYITTTTAEVDTSAFTGVFKPIRTSYGKNAKGTGGGGCQIEMNFDNATPTANEIRPINTSVRYLIRSKS